MSTNFSFDKQFLTQKFYKYIVYILILLCGSPERAFSSIINEIDLNGKRIGIFHGTFDPPHDGHLKVAKAALESGNLDYVLFIPNDNAFYKPGVSRLEFRWKLSQIITQNHPKIIVPEFGELANSTRIEPNGNYLDLLLSSLNKKGANLIGIIGSDNARANYPEGFFYLEADINIKEWLINRRGNDSGALPNYLTDKTTHEQKPASSFNADDGGVSSTDVRNSLKSGQLNVPIPVSVLEEIVKAQAYGVTVKQILLCSKVFQ